MSDNKKDTFIDSNAEVVKLTELFQKHNPEFRFDPQVSHRWLVESFREHNKESSREKEDMLKVIEGMCNYWEWSIADPNFEEYRAAQDILYRLRPIIKT